MTGNFPAGRPTREQLVVLAAIGVDDEPGDRLRDLLRADLDWSLIADRCLQEAVLPLVYTRLKATAPELVPRGAMARLSELYQLNVRRNLRLTRRLLHIIDRFEDAGIEAVPHKGPVIAAQAYGDVTLRQFIDLDIRIHGRDLRRASAVLEAAGYAMPFSIDAKRERWLARSGKELAFHDRTDCVEIQWSIASRFMAIRVPGEMCWQDLSSIELLGKRVPVSSSHATMLLLPIHAACHGFYGLKWIADIAHFAGRARDLDWKRLWGAAKRHGVERILNLGLLLAREVCGLQLPPCVLASVQADRTLPGLAARAITNLSAGASQPSFPAYFLFWLRMRERWRDRLFSCFDLAFSPKQGDWLAIDLPRALYPLYYLTRPIRLLRSFAQAKAAS